ncbi:hypothetical protein BDV93DRAFT_508599 [Ceratobasidium sp. AG-I]|nr:hypothetical protein BDV93DRAFT_508599 [Ceratobasidium sp. AG-I]
MGNWTGGPTVITKSKLERNSCQKYGSRCLGYILGRQPGDNAEVVTALSAPADRLQTRARRKPGLGRPPSSFTDKTICGRKGDPAFKRARAQRLITELQMGNEWITTRIVHTFFKHAVAKTNPQVAKEDPQIAKENAGGRTDGCGVGRWARGIGSNGMVELPWREMQVKGVVNPAAMPTRTQKYTF